MATKPEIIKAIDEKIIAKGNISAVDTNRILKDILEFSDKPATTPAPINGFDFGNIKDPLNPTDSMSVKMNFTGIHELCCSLYLCTESALIKPKSIDTKDNTDWIFLPLKDEEYKILQSFLPNINKKQMYLTFLVPFFKAENVDLEVVVDNPTNGTTGPAVGVRPKASSGFDFPMTIIGIGLLIDKKQQPGVHLILPEPGHISTSITLSYKPNNMKYELFTSAMQDNINQAFDSIITDNDLDLSNNKK